MNFVQKAWTKSQQLFTSVKLNLNDDIRICIRYDNKIVYLQLRITFTGRRPFRFSNPSTFSLILSIARYFYYEVHWLPTLIIQLLYKHISRFLHWISVILHKQCKLTLTIILVHKMLIIISMNWEVLYVTGLEYDCCFNAQF